MNPTHSSRASKTTPWNTAFFETILTTFPKDIRPIYIPFSRLRGSPEFFIRRAVFISITTPMQDMMLSVKESLLVKKTVYRHFRIDEKTSIPEKLSCLYIAREGNSRQILNEESLLKNLTRLFHDISINKRFFGKLSFEEQVQLMSKTDIVFGIHGAAFINVLFMRPKSGLIEYFSPVFSATYYETISRKSYILYSSIKDNVVSKKDKKVLKDKRNANLNVSIRSSINKFRIMISQVWEEKYKSVPLV